MKKIIAVLFSLLLLQSAFAYELSCVGSRYMGIKKYNLTVSAIDTSYGNRSGLLVLNNSNDELILKTDVRVAADYMEGESLLSVESRDLDVHGYVDMSAGKGEIQIKGKWYSLDRCEYAN